jgi:hypothetical protein
MRILTSILGLSLVAGPLAAAEIVRWVDKDGVVHFSDRPQDAAQSGAEKVQIVEAPRPGSVAPAPGAPVTTRAKPFTYAGCDISSPNPDQVFQNVRSVSISINVQPALQLDHTIAVRVNGARVPGWPPGSSGYLLSDLPRGTYTVSAQVLDARGTPVCSSAPMMFHIRQPSMLTPGARTAR